MDETILIERLIGGSEKAFDEIYKIYSARILSFSLRYVKSREVAEEIVQDVFVKLWINREKIQSRKSIKALIFTIARNNLINKYRSTLNSPVYEEYVEYRNNMKVAMDNASHLIEYDDFCVQIKSAMKKLSNSQSNIWECCKLQGLSNKETAQLLGISEKSVKNQLSLSLKIMKTELKILSLYLIAYISINN